MKKFLSLLILLSLLLTGCAETAPAQPAVSGRELLVHFIDVGQADCALLEWNGEFVLIDGGNRDDGQLVVSYLEQQGVQELAAVFCTHAHEDHVGGLPSVLAVYPTAAVYAPTKTYSSNIFDDFLYYTDQQGLEVTIPAPGDTLSLGEATLTVLGPVRSYAETNDTSLVLRLEYGQTSFLFTGDMEKEAEGDMLDHWEAEPHLLQCDVLKVGHHGSDTSTGYRLLKEVSPTYGIISVGADNSYGHPHKEPLERLEQAEVTLLRTDELGHILANSDGSVITFTWGNQNFQPTVIPPETEAETNPAQPIRTYIGNRNSQVLHTHTCGSLPNPENRVYFETYEEALAQGYKPHKGCLE